MCASAWFSFRRGSEGGDGFSVDMFYVPHQLPSETRTISSSHHVVDLLLALVAPRRPLLTQCAASCAERGGMRVRKSSSDRSEKVRSSLISLLIGYARRLIMSSGFPSWGRAPKCGSRGGDGMWPVSIATSLKKLSHRLCCQMSM